MPLPGEFLIFGTTLLGIAVLHRLSLWIAIAGLASAVAFKCAFTGFETGPGLTGLAHHVGLEWVTLANLVLLLVGFTVLAHHFEVSRLPRAIPGLLPRGWPGGLVLLLMVLLSSVFLDNIAAAVIGGVVARHVYGGRVSVGFLACLVAAANAGGAGSVLGDTTTTMMWLRGVPPLHVTPAFLGTAAAFVVFAVPGAVAQHRFAPIEAHVGSELAVDWVRVGVVAFTLAVIVITNVISNVVMPGVADVAPVLGLAIWVAILLSTITRSPDWRITPAALKSAAFLTCLVALASLMPVKQLPPASWSTTLGLGAVSSVFDNIPLTALTLKQGGYDWGLLAYAVGFGGSMMWFGSSAGVALTNMYPEGRSVTAWLKGGWCVPLAYLAGFFVMLAVRGWRPG